MVPGTGRPCDVVAPSPAHGQAFFGVEEEMGVKQDACNIPLALQHQMLIQAALSVLTLVLAALAMVFFSIIRVFLNFLGTETACLSRCSNPTRRVLYAIIAI